jgi:hypothetical protein
MVLRDDMLVVDAKAFTVDYLYVTVEAHESKILDLVGTLNTDFIDKAIKNFVLDWRKKTVARGSSDVVPE